MIMGPPGWFIGLFVIAIVVGIGMTIYRVSLARDMARRAGLDPDDATATTLLTNNGLDATYLATSLRQGQSPAASMAAAPKSAESRLQELQHLLDQGLITQAEYDDRRRAVLADI